MILKGNAKFNSAFNSHKKVPIIRVRACVIHDVNTLRVLTDDLQELKALYP